MVAVVVPTSTPVTSVNPVPLRVTVLPAATFKVDGLVTVMRGMTVNAALDAARSPVDDTTVTGPVIAVLGTVTVIDVLPLRDAMAAVAPPANSTLLARSRPLPAMVSDAPVSSDAGENDATDTGPTIVTCCELWRAVPPVSTSVRNAVLAPAGTSRPSEVAVCAAIANAVVPSRADATRSRFVPVTVSRPGGVSVVGETALT
jgi:hypothetical protein